MRYLILLAAVLVSAPACAAEFTDKIELRPGHAEPWQAPRPFKNVVLGNPDIVEVVPGQTNQEIIIIMKPDGGTTNILLNDENGKQVANLRVTQPAIQYQPARSAKTGTLSYRKDPECYPDCVRVMKPNETKRADAAQSNAPQPNSKASEK